jgi:uncharacterized protein
MDLSFDVGGHEVSAPAVLGLGAAVGFIAGMFGVGGGFLLVPLLHVVLSVPLPAAVGAALTQTIATGTGAFLRFRRMGHAELRFDVMLIGGSLIGVDAGVRLLTALGALGAVEIAGRAVPAVQLLATGGYAVIFLVIAAVLWFKPSPSADEPARPGPLARLRCPPHTDLPSVGLRGVSGPVVGCIGFVNGVIAGMLGIGGGICLIPIMLYGFGFNILKTAGTGIVVVLAVAVVGTVQHARMGNVHLGLAFTLMIGGALAAQLGAGVTASVSPRVLRRLLGVVMILTLVALVFKVLR